jgi:lipopolysaccharide export system protein LptC
VLSLREQQTLIAAALVGLVAFTAWWSLEIYEAERQAVVRPGEPDYLLTAFERTSTTPDGNPSERLDSPLLVHYSDGGGAELVRPRMRFYTAGIPDWQVVSERAWVDESQDVILLYGEVEGWREGPDGARETEFITRDLRALRGRRYAETDASGVLRKGPTTSFGVGLELDLARNHLTLLSHVRSIHRPPPAAPAPATTP